MAMFPALMNDTMFSDLFDDPFFEGWRNTDNTMSAVMPANMMTTDVRETDKGYDVDIDMPGFKKEDINLELNNGYLTVSASRCSEHEDKAPTAEDEASDSKCACASDSGKWLRRERYAGSCSRSFYVGEDVKDSDIHASYKDGTLCLEMPKPEAQQQVETKHQIAIEG